MVERISLDGCSRFGIRPSRFPWQTACIEERVGVYKARGEGGDYQGAFESAIISAMSCAPTYALTF